VCGFTRRVCPPRAGSRGGEEEGEGEGGGGDHAGPRRNKGERPVEFP
jgi:hypothetical protein